MSRFENDTTANPYGAKAKRLNDQRWNALLNLLIEEHHMVSQARAQILQNAAVVDTNETTTVVHRIADVPFYTPQLPQAATDMLTDEDFAHFNAVIQEILNNILNNVVAPVLANAVAKNVITASQAVALQNLLAKNYLNPARYAITPPSLSAAKPAAKVEPEVEIHPIFLIAPTLHTSVEEPLVYPFDSGLAQGFTRFFEPELPSLSIEKQRDIQEMFQIMIYKTNSNVLDTISTARRTEARSSGFARPDVQDLLAHNIMQERSRHEAALNSSNYGSSHDSGIELDNDLSSILNSFKG